MPTLQDIHVEQQLLQIQQIVEQRHDRKQEAISTFIRHFYAEVSASDLNPIPPEDLYGAAMQVYNLTRKSVTEKDVCKLRIYNPSLEENGWHSTHTVIEAVQHNRPFLVDSVTIELRRRGLNIHFIVHPVFHFVIDNQEELGLLPGLSPKDVAANLSLLHIQIDAISDTKEIATLQRTLNEIFIEVRQVVDDWRPMKKLLLDKAKSLENQQDHVTAYDFLIWLSANHITLLGYRYFAFDGKRYKAEHTENLGILRDVEKKVFPLKPKGGWHALVHETVRASSILWISKASSRVRVHRGVYPDAILYKAYDDQGKEQGVHLWIGLFTSSVYQENLLTIPLLREKVQYQLDRFGYPPESHNGKALLHILHHSQRDDLFQMENDILFVYCRRILQLNERQHITLFIREDPLKRYAMAVVFLPKEKAHTQLRQQFGEILARALNGRVADYQTHMGESLLCRMRYTITTPFNEIPKYNPRELEAELAQVARDWQDNLRQALIERQGELQGLKLLRAYRQAFPLSYQEHNRASVAVNDILRVEATRRDGKLGISLYHPVESPEYRLKCKIYAPKTCLVLSDIVPIFEQMGLKVLEENSYRIGRQNPSFIHDFLLQTHDNAAVDIHRVRPLFESCLEQIWRGEIENDALNRLVISAGLDAREIVVLRAYCKYLQQLRTPYSQAFIHNVLDRQVSITKAIVALFQLRFTFPPNEQQDKAYEKQMEILEQQLDQVQSLDEDVILRQFLQLIQATLRTNYYQNQEQLVFKLDPRQLTAIPQPAPLREVFIYAPDFEAVHLRFGLVARGGIRWSDRSEDFRTEVLGLVKAQQVKNAVIVPQGAKGGFVLKNPPSDWRALHRNGINCYRRFISAMLDITDNLREHAVIAPEQLTRHDDDDPYLVVAADKGTARFSDYANSISRERGFWLGDAFASGGSQGYDHKKMGITARGAWESVRRHFYELGHDVQHADFTVVGVGDMSGDVFGNGMLLSPHICLIGAFNHQHIFLDPQPDAASAFAERQRLFAAGDGTWDQYDSKKISAGGGVFPRGAKFIPLNAALKRLLKIRKNRATPNEVIRALLQSSVDLLWFGGIGTYIKAASESAQDVGDRSNDALRVDATSVVARVIVEGANLGITHRGRIEYCQHGGRCNTDFIDNSAGVSCSDHEVNIKILLQHQMEQGELTEKQRNQLLVQMTDEVTQLVLTDNYQQNLSLSMTCARAATHLEQHQQLIYALERASVLDRKLEFLPSDKEFREYQQQHQGLTRPELSVLLAYAKNYTYTQLLASEFPDADYLQNFLVNYFPQELRQRFMDTLLQHPLRREIICTVVTNTLLNRTGFTIVNDLHQRNGNSYADIAHAFMMVREIFTLPLLWEALEKLEQQSADVEQQRDLLLVVRDFTQRACEWFLVWEHAQPDTRMRAYRNGIAQFCEQLPDILPSAVREDYQWRCAKYVANGLNDTIAARLAALPALLGALDIVQLAQQHNQAVERTAQVFTALDERFAFTHLCQLARGLPANNRWMHQALHNIVADLNRTQRRIGEQILLSYPDAHAPFAAWCEDHASKLTSIEGWLVDIRQQTKPDLAVLDVANRVLQGLDTPNASIENSQGAA